MLKKYKHVSFDLDGTLVHTVPEYRHAVVPQAVKQLGGSIKDAHAIDRFWFESGRDEVIKNDFNLDPVIFWNLFRSIDTAEQRGLHTRAYDDAEPCIRSLKRAGKTVAVLTGAPVWIAHMELRKLNGAPIDLQLSITDGGFLQKPDPGSFFYVLNHLGISPKETVYIGNSNEDAYYARNAGVDFIYLERKEHEFDLKDYAVATIHSLAELTGSHPGLPPIYTNKIYETKQK